jgi:hypothetical protein
MGQRYKNKFEPEDVQQLLTTYTKVVFFDFKERKIIGSDAERNSFRP